MTLNDWELFKKRAYVPYSGHRDACFAIGRSGSYYPGVRIENISFPLSVDPVQTALFSCLSEGDTPDSLLAPRVANGNGDSGIPGDIHNWHHLFDLDVRYVDDRLLPDTTHIFKTAEKSAVDITRLSELTKQCIVPYSGFPVTALLKTDIGIFSGVNIELSDWQKGLCAERVAIVKAIASGATILDTIYIFAPQSDYVSPCGACRQVISEQMSNGILVLQHNEIESTRFTISDLLPYQFRAANLSIDRPK